MNNSNNSPVTILAFDPGKVTGIVEGVFSETEPLALVDAIAVTYEELLEGFEYLLEASQTGEYDHVVTEQFDLRTNNEYAANLDGVRVEGLLDLAFGDQLVRRPRSKKEQVSDATLKEHGLWKTGAEVDWEDGRDVNDAIIHMLGYVAFDLRHRPTITKYFKPNYGKVELR